MLESERPREAATDPGGALHGATSTAKALEARLRAFLEKSHDAVALLAADGSVAWVSPSVEAILGRPPEHYEGRDPISHVVECERERVAALLADVAARPGASFTTELAALHADGTTRAIALTARNLLADPAVGAIVCNFRDVTREKRAADALHQSEQRYRRIVEGTSEGVWMYDEHGVTTFMNARLATLLGTTVERAVGRPIFDFLFEEDWPAARDRLAARRSGSAERAKMRLRREDGAEVFVDVHADPLLDERGVFEHGLAFVADASAERRAEEARAHLAAIVESSEDAIVSTSFAGVITSWNDAATRLYGYARDEAVGRNVAMLVPAALRDDVMATVRQSLATRAAAFETRAVRKDGAEVEVGMTISTVRDGTGRPIGFSAIVRDLTIAKRAEAALRRTEEQLRQAQKMEAIGRLAGGVAHDFNNMLSIILSGAELALDGLRAGDPLRAELEPIREAGARAAELTRRLLAFSRQQMLSPRVVDLNETVAGMDSMLRRLLGEDVDLAFHAGERLGHVVADPAQIEQVVMNLAVNARDAMPRGGRLTIETSNVELDDAYAAQHVGVAVGDYVMLAVSDTGVGMDAETRARIFEPFFTTKGAGKGTGLGLATVFGIVQQSGGFIWVYSEPGHGSTFKVYLPRASGGLATTRPSGGANELARGTETVLLVEDEERVRSMARTILQRGGYEVLESANAGEAFLLARRHPGPIHLLLTDVVMPHMSGRELAHELAGVRPEMRVLYVSGYTDDAVVRHGVLEQGVAFLQKPFTPGSLLRRIREVLAE
ncbi:MAG TPA: PAS domain S-box protein [Minicystis sp.]|nr:PAS domain S-box protein [Minicystis sp.]